MQQAFRHAAPPFAPPTPAPIRQIGEPTGFAERIGPYAERFCPNHRFTGGTRLETMARSEVDLSHPERVREPRRQIDQGHDPPAADCLGSVGAIIGAVLYIVTRFLLVRPPLAHTAKIRSNGDHNNGRHIGMPARVVVVRGDPIREAMVEALREAGVNVAAFDAATAALGAIEADGRCEVLVTQFDFGPGQQNGISLALMLRLKRPRLKVLFVGREQYRELTEGIGEYMPAEPLDLPRIVAAVRRMLGEDWKT